MLTFQEQYTTIQEEISDTSDETLVLIKRFLNTGVTIFRSRLKRPFLRLSRTTDLVADQQYYQLPEDVIRPSGVVVTVGDNQYPVREITSENIWRELNASSGASSATPMYYFLRGNDEIGLFPTPASAVTAGLEVWFEPRIGRMSQPDYTTGTITVTNGSASVTHSGTGFTPGMVGRYLIVENGMDSIAYRIAAYVSTSQLTLENYYAGDSGSGLSFRIGEASGIPEDFETAPMDYALHRLYLRRRNRQLANDYKALFEAAIDDARSQYASPSSGSIVVSPTRYGSPFDAIHRSPGVIT